MPPEPTIIDTSRRWPGAAASPPHLATLVIMAGISAMAMNIFLPVLPVIARELNTTDAMAQYVLTLFLATTAVVQLVIGPVSDRFGRRPVLLITTSMFLAGTVICLLASSIEVLLLGRVLQASAAASLSLGRAIIRDLYDRSRAASMIGYVTMAMALIPMLGPVAGGYAGEMMGWRGPFFVLLATSFIMLAVVYFDLGETHQPRRSSASKQVDDSVALLKEPAIWGYFLAATSASGAYFAFLGGAPFVGGKVIGMSVSEMGLNFIYVALGYIAGNFLSGRFSERIGIELMMMWGGVIATLGVALALALTVSIGPRAEFLFWPMALVGMGNGMTLPNSIAGAVSVRPDLAGSASGLGGFLQIGGGAALATLSGYLISVENLGLPLFVIMLASSAASAVISFLMLMRSRRQGTANSV